MRVSSPVAVVSSMASEAFKPAMSAAHQFERLRSRSDPAFEEFYRIYAESIAERGRKSKTWIGEMVASLDYATLLSKKEDGRVTG